MVKGTFWFDNTILDFMKTHFIDSLNNKFPFITSANIVEEYNKRLKSKILFELFFEYFKLIKMTFSWDGC